MKAGQWAALSRVFGRARFLRRRKDGNPSSRPAKVRGNGGNFGCVFVGVLRFLGNAASAGRKGGRWRGFQVNRPDGSQVASGRSSGLGGFLAEQGGKSPCNGGKSPCTEEKSPGSGAKSLDNGAMSFANGAMSFANEAMSFANGAFPFANETFPLGNGTFPKGVRDFPRGKAGM